MLGPYARYGGLNGFGILLHAQLSYWGPGKQLLDLCHVYDCFCVFDPLERSVQPP